MEALIIDFNSDDQECNEHAEMFLTTFGSFTDDQAFNTTTVLVDRSLAHAITPASTPREPITEPDPFAYANTD